MGITRAHRSTSWSGPRSPRIGRGVADLDLPDDADRQRCTFVPRASAIRVTCSVPPEYVKCRQTYAETGSPTAGIPGPDVLAAATVLVQYASSEVPVQGPRVSRRSMVDWPSVVAPLRAPVRTPTPKLPPGWLADPYPGPALGAHFEIVTVLDAEPDSLEHVTPLPPAAPTGSAAPAVLSIASGPQYGCRSAHSVPRGVRPGGTRWGSPGRPPGDRGDRSEEVRLRDGPWEADRMAEHGGPGARRLSRRRLIGWGAAGVGAVVVAAASGAELVAHGVLPGKQTLDALDGACSVSSPPLVHPSPGVSESGAFFSEARNTRVGYSIAYPPGHPRGDPLPLIVMLHGFGGNHTDALAGMTPAQAVALHVDGVPLPPMAMVTVDGGGGYWNPHPGDDPMAMVMDELLPRCQESGLGAPPRKIGTMGISMGGYGAILLAEKYPGTFSAVAAISPAIWTSYDEAERANAGAYASREEFSANDAVTHVDALAGMPVRIASGSDDPFHPGVVALAEVVPASTTVTISGGCHTDPFFVSQEPPSLQFLGRHLA